MSELSARRKQRRNERVAAGGGEWTGTGAASLAAAMASDPHELAQWYFETLGCKVNYTSATSKTVFVRAPNGSMLEIIESKGERAPQSLKDPGIRHLAIAVSDFEAAYAELKQKNVKFVDEPLAAKGNKVVFFADPDGNYLHLIWREKPLPQGAGGGGAASGDSQAMQRGRARGLCSRRTYSDASSERSHVLNAAAHASRWAFRSRGSPRSISSPPPSLGTVRTRCA